MSNTLIAPLLRFTGPEADLAQRAWGCNSDPCALAAALGMTLNQVREILWRYENINRFDQRHIDVEMMRKSIENAGYQWAQTFRFPEHGIRRILVGGPWYASGKATKTASKYTHWIATKIDRDSNRWVYDWSNNGEGWWLLDEWERLTMDLLVSMVKRSDGMWHKIDSYEIRKKT